MFNPAQQGPKAVQGLSQRGYEGIKRLFQFSLTVQFHDLLIDKCCITTVSFTTYCITAYVS